VVLVVAAAAMGAAVPARAPAAAAPAGEAARADFDDDGFVDLAVGVPSEDVEARADAGSVVVLYGSVGGLTGARAQQFHQDLPQVVDRAEPGDRFGSALASADLNGDGFADLVAGAPREAVGTAAGTGGVVYLPGSAGGLTAAGNRVYVQGAGGLGGRAEFGDRFGEVLATGQANAGGPADLVVGAPGENLAAGAGAGAVSVLHGAPGGPSTAGDQLLFQGAGGIPDAPETNDGFGSALAVGDLDGDSFPDLAVGVPGEEYFANTDVGDVILLHGTAGGLSGAGAQSMQQDISNIGSNEAGDHIGSALAARDFDADGAGDLVVGMPGEDIDKLRDAGAVAYHQGPLGPERPESRPLHADSAGVPGAAEPGDRFGAVLGPGPLGG
jgi:hypothetical protein